MQYVFSMTSRMVTIALGSALLLCALLFLLGFEIGARFVGPASSPARTVPAATLALPSPSPSPAPAAAPAVALPAPGDAAQSPAAASDSSTY
jgi:hypothetical protein